MQTKAQQCDGKREHADYPAAKEAAKRCSRGTGARMQPYRCLHCRHWHIGEHIGPAQLGRKPSPVEVE